MLSSQGHVSLECVVVGLVFRLMQEGPWVVNVPEVLTAYLKQDSQSTRTLDRA